MNIEIGQIVTQMIAFLIMLAILKRFAWKPLLQVMQERRERIKNEFDDIAMKQQEVQTLKKMHQERLDLFKEEIKKLKKEEENKVRAYAREIEEEAQKRAHDIIYQAHLETEEEIMKAKADLKKALVNLTIKATEVVLQKDVDLEKQKLVAKYIEEAKLL